MSNHNTHYATKNPLFCRGAIVRPINLYAAIDIDRSTPNLLEIECASLPSRDAFDVRDLSTGRIYRLIPRGWLRFVARDRGSLARVSLDFLGGDV